MPTEELIAHSLGALKSLIDAMKLLSGADKKPTSQKDLSSVLKSRLLALNDLHITELTYAEHELDVLDVDGVQYRTANAALWILERLYTQLQASGADELSLNEQNSLRRLAALVYRWKISKELEGCNAVEESARSSAQERLLESTSRVLRLIFPEEEERGGNNAVQIMFKQSFPDLLPALFTLGWAPLGEKAESIRALTYRLLSSLSTLENMQTLGSLINSSQVPGTAKRSIKLMLSRLILRPNGVSSLLETVFGSEEHGGGEMLARYEQTSRLLSTPPGKMGIEEYYRVVVPQMLNVIRRDGANATHQRAIAFALSGMISAQKHQEVITNVLQDVLFARFKEPTELNKDQISATYSPLQAIMILSILLAMTPPSIDTPLATILLGPVAEKLYSLLYYLESRAISDPAEISACKGLLYSWAKVSDPKDVVEKLSSIVEGHGGDWVLGIANEDDDLILQWTSRLETSNPQLAELGNLEEDAMEKNSLNLRPDPIHLVGFIQSIRSNDVAALFFIQVLSAANDNHEDDPSRQLLRMQLIYQLQKRIPSAILSNPEHAIAFVDHALSKGQTQGLSTEPSAALRFVNGNDAADNEQDAEILRTAVEYLLSCLEANPEYVPSIDDPHVPRISLALKSLGTHPSFSLRQIAREATLVLMARQSGSSVANQKSDAKTKDSRQIYQEALILLQDPLLPVRAQGLATLRHLMDTTQHPSFDVALVPAILDIFISSVQDEDSFIFLNAVQGLAVMVQRFGKDVFRRLLDVYELSPHAAGRMNRQELDIRLRVGEALADVIGKCGQSLGGYVDLLVPVILAMIRDNSLPTTLRTSAIGVATQCFETSPLAMARFSLALSNSMLDILELEHSVQVERRGNARRAQSDGGERDITSDEAVNGKSASNRRSGQIGDLMTDQDPTDISPKLSPLRRSAIRLLGSIIRHFLQAGGERSDYFGDDALEFPVRRAGIVLRYLGAHDADAVVNAMALETAGMLSEVGRIRLGLRIVG